MLQENMVYALSFLSLTIVRLPLRFPAVDYFAHGSFSIADKYYHGSKYDFINFRRATNAYPGDAFYGNRAVVNAFVGYIQKVVSHVNPYTGLSYANDPTILAWETGNELGG